MYYLPTDYLVLPSSRDKKTALDALLEAACVSLPYPLSKGALAFSLGKLCAGGYIEGYALTDKGVLIESYPIRIENGVLMLDSEGEGDYVPVETDAEGCLLIGDTTVIEKI